MLVVLFFKDLNIEKLVNKKIFNRPLVAEGCGLLIYF